MPGRASKPKSLLQRQPENGKSVGGKGGNERGKEAGKGKSKAKEGGKAFFQLSPNVSCKKLKVARANYLILLSKYLLRIYIYTVNSR